MGCPILCARLAGVTKRHIVNVRGRLSVEQGDAGLRRAAYNVLLSVGVKARGNAELPSGCTRRRHEGGCGDDVRGDAETA